MQKNQILFLAAGIMLFSLLYFGGKMVGKQTTGKAPMANRDQAQGSGPMMSPMAEVEPMQIGSYLQDAKLQLKGDALLLLKDLESKDQQASTAVTNKDLAEFWEKQENLNAAAHFYKKAAFLENTEKSITFAGNLFLAILQRTEKPEQRKWQALEAIACFNKALELNPSNVDSKISLATCYTDGTGETMKGVTLLREITQADSTNVPANITLGKLAIQSGQFDKAVKRLELVLSQQPKNTEAMYFLAEAFRGKGDKQKAIELFERCKKEVKDPEFAKEIDSYINSFK
ncbi:MAG: tetratricopeptide repeat protein [Chitinophagaceae bacterium]|nr:tetratricopeptide repeat protein [Chitinophagaceae bacterium]